MLGVTHYVIIITSLQYTYYQEYIIIEEGGECLTLNIIHTNTLRSNAPTSIHKTSSNKPIPLSEQKTVDVS